MRLTESAYEWAKIPVDLPRGNLVLITAKTTLPTIHPSDTKYPIRLFNPTELYERAASLTKRPVGANHIRKKNPIGFQFLPPYLQNNKLIEADGLIEGAFTVDSQWNKSTQAVEALIFLPTEYINSIRLEEAQGHPVKYSVEYTWRDEKKTEFGTEFIGLCFDRVDLIYGLPAGDKATSGRLVEVGEERRGLMEAEIVSLYEALYESADEFDKHLGEPFADFKDWDACITHAKAKGVSNPDAWCGAIKAKTEDNKGKESSVMSMIPNINVRDANLTGRKPQLPEQTNTMTSPSDVVLPPVEVSTSTPQPHENVTSIGAIPDNMGGPIGLTPAVGNPDKNLNQEPAKEENVEGESPKGEGNPVIENSKVLSPDISNQSIDNNNKPNGEECMEDKKLKESGEPPKEEKKEEEKKPEEKKVEEVKPPVSDPKDEEIKNLKEAVVKLQANVKTADTEKDKAVKEAEKKGKESVISKVREVIPESGFFAGNIAVTATKRVVDDVNRKLRESMES